MKKLEISTTGTHGYGAGFLLPTSGGTRGGVCLEQVRPRRDDVMTTVLGSRDAVDGRAVQGAAQNAAPSVASTAPGLPSSAPPIT